MKEVGRKERWKEGRKGGRKEGGGSRGEEGEDSQLMEKCSTPPEEFQRLSFHP